MSNRDDRQQIETLSNEDLRILCYDQFPRIYNRLSRDISKHQVMEWIQNTRSSKETEKNSNTNLSEDQEAPNPATIRSNRNRPSFRQTKIKLLAEKLSALLDDYDAASKQANNTTDAVVRNRIGRQIDELDDEITKVESELEKLRKNEVEN